MEFIFAIGMIKGLNIYLVITSSLTENSFLLFWIVHVYNIVSSYP